MREAVRGLRIPHAGNEIGLVTVSIGIAATLPDADMDPSTLLRAADLALYEAKAAGRDQSVVAPEPHTLAAEGSAEPA